MGDVVDELGWRGLIGQSTDLGELREALGSGPVTFYAGFDPTGPGLHIGHLALMLTTRRLQHAGHRPIGVVGGATGLIGDPSGKSAERTFNSRETVAAWVERIRAEVARFIDLSAGSVVSNLEWAGELSAIDALRGVGTAAGVHFPVACGDSRARGCGPGTAGRARGTAGARGRHDDPGARKATCCMVVTWFFAAENAPLGVSRSCEDVPSHALRAGHVGYAGVTAGLRGSETPDLTKVCGSRKVLLAPRGRNAGRRDGTRGAT